MIRRRRLEKEVKVEGKNFWGLRSRLTCTPTEHGEPGWFWRPAPDEDLVPIDVRCATVQKRRISLAYQGERGARYLHCYEHIGVLRFTGIDGVIISVKGFPAGWPPHYGRAFELWQAISRHCKDTEEGVPWISIPDATADDDGRLVEGLTGIDGLWSDRSPGFTGLRPNSKEGRLTVLVRSDYPSVNRWTLYHSVANGYEELETPDLRDCLSAYTPGFPKRLYYVSLLARFFLRWPHHGRTVWSQKHDYAETINLWAWHRECDLLGVISLVSHTALPALHAVSYLSGHEPDLDAVKRLHALVGQDPPAAV